MKEKSPFKSIRMELIDKTNKLFEQDDSAEISAFQNERRNKIEALCKAALCKMVPPIKGEVSKGKLKWRGVRLVRQKFPDTELVWIEQRGKRISDVLVFDTFLPELETKQS